MKHVTTSWRLFFGDERVRGNSKGMESARQTVAISYFDSLAYGWLPVASFIKKFPSLTNGARVTAPISSVWPLCTPVIDSSSPLPPFFAVADIMHFQGLKYSSLSPFRPSPHPVCTYIHVQALVHFSERLRPFRPRTDRPFSRLRRDSERAAKQRPTR